MGEVASMVRNIPYHVNMVPSRPVESSRCGDLPIFRAPLRACIVSAPDLARRRFSVGVAMGVESAPHWNNHLLIQLLAGRPRSQYRPPRKIIYLRSSGQLRRAPYGSLYGRWSEMQPCRLGTDTDASSYCRPLRSTGPAIAGSGPMLRAEDTRLDISQKLADVRSRTFLLFE